MSRIDASGRLTSQAISQVLKLNWRPGDRVTLTAGPVLSWCAAILMAWSPCRPGVPSRSRPGCGLRPGDQVLLAALPHQDTLAAYSFAVVDQALRAHPLFPRREGGLS